nr:50S ribosomal protein L11 methyltransferase [uncultured Gellertiella sp.]
MSEIRFYISTTEAHSERILDILTEAFGEEDLAIGTTEVDEKKDIWEVSVYLLREEEADVLPRIRAALAGAYPDAVIAREDLPDVDWVAKSLDGLKPVRAGRFIVHGSHDRDKVQTGDIAIEIEAGQAFGTGHHGTTAGCLEVIDRVMQARRPKNALDLGTGSGVLAIAVRKLANIPVLATDIDPVATAVAKGNVRANGIATGLSLETATGFHSTAFSRHGPFDLIIANILARPLMKMAPDLARHLAPGGSVILSGILASQRWRVLAAYNGVRLRHVKTIWRNGWVTIHLDRPAV